MPNVNGIALPQSEFNWDACAKSGVVKVKNGAKVAGYYQVYDTEVNEEKRHLESDFCRQAKAQASITKPALPVTSTEYFSDDTAT